MKRLIKIISLLQVIATVSIVGELNAKASLIVIAHNMMGIICDCTSTVNTCNYNPETGVWTGGIKVTTGTYEACDFYPNTDCYNTTCGGSTTSYNCSN
jgi:hypothetical protein